MPGDLNDDGSKKDNVLTEFTELGLAEPILRSLQSEGYTTPTPIQAQVIPAMLNGRDVLGIAQTGTGKTAAFVLPVLHHIHQTKARAGSKRCTALILTPTRELANQVAASVDTYGRAMKIKTAIVVGGVKYGPQIKKLTGGVDVLIATPGRLEDLMKTGAVTLDMTGTIILDEADQMLDLGFAPAIKRILGKLPKDRQTALLSATMEKKIRALAQEFLSKPVEVSVAAADQPIERIEQGVLHIKSTVKRAALMTILSKEDVTSAIVFSRTKFGAEKLAQFLDKNGLRAGAIHGNKNQRQRERALAAFRAGKTPILVATDVAARGIDVDDISHVINFDLPNVAEAYVHRIGRTGRAGKSGIAIAFCDPSERGLLRDIERLTKNPIPVMTVEGVETLDPGQGPQGGEGGKAGRKGGRGGPRRGGGGQRGASGRDGGSGGDGEAKPWRKRTTDRNKRKKAANDGPAGGKRPGEGGSGQKSRGPKPAKGGQRPARSGGTRSSSR